MRFKQASVNWTEDASRRRIRSEACFSVSVPGSSVAPTAGQADAAAARPAFRNSLRECSDIVVSWVRAKLYAHQTEAGDAMAGCTEETQNVKTRKALNRTSMVGAVRVVAELAAR